MCELVYCPVSQCMFEEDEKSLLFFYYLLIWIVDLSFESNSNVCQCSNLCISVGDFMFMILYNVMS